MKKKRPTKPKTNRVEVGGPRALLGSHSQLGEVGYLMK